MATATPDSDLKFSFGPLPSLAGCGQGGEAASAWGRSLPDRLPFFDLASDAPLPPFPEASEFPSLPTAAPAPVRETPPTDLAPGAIWLEGEVIMCGCPECRAPMTIRLWLMIADCWNCQTSIELNEEQEREVQRLMRERDEARERPPLPTAVARTSAPAPAAPAPVRRPSPPEHPNRGGPPAPPQPPPPVPPPVDPTRLQGEPMASPVTLLGNGRPPADRARLRTEAAPPPPPRRPARTTASEAARRARLARQRAGMKLNDLVKITPAWFISLVIHFVVLTLASLFSIRNDEKGPTILLSAAVSREPREGGDVVIKPKDEVKFDLPKPRDADLSNPRVKEALIKADQIAAELRIDPDAPDPSLPDLSAVKRKITGTGGTYSTFAARDPRVRVEMVQREGGTILTEAAVARGLRWLAQQQQADGKWQLHVVKNGGGAGGIVSDPAATSLALLPFLGAGQTHLTGRYKDTVSKGLRWLVQQQRENGDLRGNSQGNSGMYAHGQGAIVLCEAFAMEGDEDLRIPAQKAIDFILKAQHPRGGWRYEPGAEGDTSVVGWQLMALQSARSAGLTVPPETFELAGHYLDSVQSRGGATYSYMPRNAPTQVMTAEALLCRMYLGWNKEEPGLLDGAKFLVERHLPAKQAPDIYYWYYGTQAMKHVGGPDWETWNSKMRDILVETQETEGAQAGSWPAQGPHAAAGGRLYMTALSTCTLEVYYRHLPIFRQIDLDGADK